MHSKKRILVAPLNWGLGHATRCIPIINNLIQFGFEPIIASDGPALQLLRKEYPELLSLELPSYKISYSKKASHFKLKILKDSPSIIKAIKKEKKVVEKLVADYALSGIISDNRFGVRDKKTPSVFITHQLQVLSGSTSWLSSKLHQRYIKKFDECWVPDSKSGTNLSGKLGHIEGSDLSIRYLGPLSRFNKRNLDIKYDLMVLLSGPEPQRMFLEERVLKELKTYSGNVLFVKGTIEDTLTRHTKDHITIYNYMTSDLLETALNESAIVLSRSGYTSIMDLVYLEKKAFFIPTPGQYEQEYLANRFERHKIAPHCNQKDFKIDLLESVHSYKGFKKIDSELNFKKLFSLFERK